MPLEQGNIRNMQLADFVLQGRGGAIKPLNLFVFSQKILAAIALWLKFHCPGSMYDHPSQKKQETFTVLNDHYKNISLIKEK